MRKICFVVILIILFTNTAIAETKEGSVVQAEVIEMVQERNKETDVQIANLKILEGKYINRTICVESLYIEGSEYSFDLHKGQKVLVSASSTNGEDISVYILISFTSFRSKNNLSSNRYCSNLFAHTV